MSTPRHLSIRFRKIRPGGREGYLGDLREVADAVSKCGGRFWVFEVGNRENLYVEFIEGVDEAVLADLEKQADRKLGAEADPGAGHGGREWPEGRPSGLRGREVRPGV